MKESWLLEIEAFSELDACAQAEQIARSRGYEVADSSAEMQRHPARTEHVAMSGSYLVRLTVIER